MFKWFKKQPKVIEPVPTQEELLAIELEKAKLPENLSLVRAKFNGSQIDTSDLKLEPFSETVISGPAFGYNIFYRKTNLGICYLNTDDIERFVRCARQNYPELFPVNIHELYNVYQTHYATAWDYTTSRLVQVTEIYMDTKTNLPMYMLKDLVTGQIETQSHAQFAYDSTRVHKIG